MSNKGKAFSIELYAVFPLRTEALFGSMQNLTMILCDVYFLWWQK